MDSSTYDIQLFYINLKNEVTLRSRAAAFYSRSVEGKKRLLNLDCQGRRRAYSHII